MTTALYRRYRPDTFDQVIGQEHVTEPLKAALRANRVTHAYLFSGPRGCGKTTSARILARCLNCAQGPTDTPCGQCESCRELATGGPGSLDVVEIDAASHGGVDDARDLRERATFAPVRDRYKIFIIDEAHMVTNQGFNALLKLVEEPPEHVKFVFATTEPERVIGTIRSRTHHYPFRLVPPDVLGPYLTTLCAEEHISVGEGVLTLVMRAGGGSVRDTLSVLDQLMAGAIDGQVTYQTAVALLGYTDSALLDQSVDALAGGDGAAAFRVVERMVESGHDPRRFVEDLLQRLRDLLIIAVAGDGARDVLADTPQDQFERMQRQAQNWGPHGLSRAADLTDEALRAMTGATSPRLQLELLVGRILVPTPTAAPAPGPVQGTVGMTGGGAPRAASAPSSHEASSGRFGAREAREAENEARLSLRALEEQSRRAASRARSLRQAAAAEREERARYARREAARKTELATASDVEAAARIALEAAERALSRAATERDRLSARRSQVSREVSDARCALDRMSAELADAMNSANQGKIAVEQTRVRVEDLQRRALEELSLEPEQLIAEFGPEVMVPVLPLDPDDVEKAEAAEPRAYMRAEQERALATAQKDLEKLGRVNPLALEEHEALASRHKFLVDQVQDLKQSKADLLRIVQDVDRLVEEAFASAFAETREQFEHVFGVLFPGGQGGLVLTDPDDMLTTGFEIEARPAGKRVKRLSLLSGGERSLAAIAFLVAIFKARPSPFYVMDEVEAALDDMNLTRMLTIFKELQETSQLIVITHQKRTMEIADALYGVTMRDGITRVVSQRLAD